MTLDEVVATMRQRFTPRSVSEPVTEAKITAEEWNTLAALVYLRDAIESLPVSEDPAITNALAEAAKSRGDNPSRER